MPASADNAAPADTAAPTGLPAPPQGQVPGLRLALFTGAVIALVLTAFNWNSWRALLTQDTPLVVTWSEDFEDEMLDGIPGLEMYGDWIHRNGALCLEKQGSLGGIWIKFELPPDSDTVFIRLWIQGLPYVTNQVRFSALSDSSKDYLQLPSSRWVNNFSSRASGKLWTGLERRFSLNEETKAIIFDIRAGLESTKHGEMMPVIQRIETGYYLPDVHDVPPFPLMLMIGAIAIWAMLLWFNRKSFDKQFIFPFLVTIFFLIGAWLRWDWFIQTTGQPLSPDGAGFLQIIQTMTGPYDTAATIAPWVREPFFPWVGWLWFRLTPDTANALRLLTVLLSIGAVGAAWEAGRRLIHPFAGFTAAFLMAFNDYLIFSAPRGLREELFLILTLWLVALFFALWRRPQNGVAPRLTSAFDHCKPCAPCLWKWFALAASLVVLTRVTSLAFVLPMIIALTAAHRFSLRASALTLLIIAIPLLPHLIFNYHYSEERDPFFSANVHARFYRNLEFAGQPGFPAAAEVAAEPYAGGPITSARYIFGLHSPAQWAAFPLKGLVKLFATDFAYKAAFNAHKLLLAVYAIAFLLTFTQRRWWGLGIVLLLMAAPVAFVVGAVAVDPRLLVQFMPFQFFILAIGLLRMRELIGYGMRSFKAKH